MRRLRRNDSHTIESLQRNYKLVIQLKRIVAGRKLGVHTSHAKPLSVVPYPRCVALSDRLYVAIGPITVY